MEARIIRLYGIVQGVGFRPFVYRLATRLGLTGYVANRGGAEVEIWIEGGRGALEKFIELLDKEKPGPAEIWEKHVEPVKPAGYTSFRIERSRRSKTGYSMIPPDIGICSDCAREIMDPSSRFHRYPFHSCVVCGPRYTIMYSSVWDRGETSIKYFPLCSRCLEEYNDPGNTRRFHAQGISCPVCGPRVWLADRNGCDTGAEDPVTEAARLIDEGYIVAVKGLGGFHIAVSATMDEPLERLRRLKNRPRKPFAIMALDIEAAGRLIELDPETRRLLESPWKPIVIARKRGGAPVSPLVAPGLSTLGVMLAYTALHILLLKATRDKYLVMTSGNRGGERIIKDNMEAIEKLRGIADYFLLHNREIVNRVDDSVIRVYRGHKVFIRRSRGYAPRWLRQRVKGGKTIAFGAHLVNAGAVGFDDKIIPTPYVGDMDSYSNIEFLMEALGFLMKTYDIGFGEAVLVADKHPGYTTRRLAERIAEEHGSTLLLLQHHVAHAYSVVADKGLDPGRDYVAIIMDGTGYGDDGNIWGGEVLALSPAEQRYRRTGWLHESPIPGGDKAAENPVLMLVARLSTIYGLDEIREIICREKPCPWDIDAYYRLSRAAKLRTSSTGRHLDAVAALLEITYKRTYEGEPAIRLEESSSEPVVFWRECDVLRGNTVDTEKLFTWLVENIKALPKPVLAATAQYYIGYGLGCLAAQNADPGTPVLVAGGAAANSYIVEAIRRALRDNGHRGPVILPENIPVGDGGVAAGQALYGLIYSRR